MFFSDSQCDFRSSRSTADLLIVLSDRISRVFNRSGATVAVAIDISKAFDKHMLVVFTNLRCMEFLVRHLALYCLLSVIDGTKWFWEVFTGISS